MSLLDNLRKLRDDGPQMLYFGICHNIQDEHVDDFIELASRWPKYSGCREYPVPHPTMSPVVAFSVWMNLWEGEYGENRRELLSWSIEELERDAP